ncbi:phosphopentomutase [Marivivens niveibacter]|uniref:Phosphopentomutase n=1 Tax=Marivivens niveibacter TaxID=1930667 RepID=A0A251WYP0_9RHOB|nr:phosphopentomutase [Marivivens niveibacter]OUD09063.1 phosphopentomutase [Marivivens niveibacter]
MTRAFLVVMDSVGIGGAPDADKFFNDGQPDTGANTVAHIAAEMANDRPLLLPTLTSLGLGRAVELASGETAVGLDGPVDGAWGAATEISNGKDTPSGHWELAGVPVPWDWTVFEEKQNSFPPEVIEALCKAAGTDGILANCHASGTEIIERLGDEHVKTGWPICYTSVDSVLQIAAHEEHFGLDRLLDLCRAVAPMLHDMRVGRVIARPFVGESGQYSRTSNRKDFAIAPPADTLCDVAAAAGRPVHAIGKIGDIFSMRGITDVRKGRDIALMQHLSDWVEDAEDGSLTFANFVEFDSEYGHRRDVAGYAAHLEWFDAEIGNILPRLGEGDLLVITADHGNDPTWIGTDHTRERVPVLVHGLGHKELGHLAFTDVAELVAEHLGLPPMSKGRA